MPSEYDYRSCELYYLRTYTAGRRECLGAVNGRHFRLSAAGRKLYGHWAFLPERYPQVKLDAFGLLPNYIHGIVGVDVEEQHRLRIARPRSVNIIYSFFEVVRGLQDASSALKPASLQRGFSFYRILGDSLLERTRILIRRSPSVWLADPRNCDATNWPLLRWVSPDLRAAIVRARDLTKSILVAPAGELSPDVLLQVRIAEVAANSSK